jgi:hypothetical protein
MAVIRKSAASSGKKLVPATPEAGGAVKKRKRLAKAFDRPLEKKSKKDEMVRDKFSLPESEYARLVKLKQQLLAQGIDVKKSEILRAGLAWLVTLDEQALGEAVIRILPVSERP